MTDKTTMELEEGEREILLSALEIMNPDSPEGAERLEVFTQEVLDATLESGVVEMRFDASELELGFSALEIVDPDDFEAQELAEDLAGRMRSAHEDISAEAPEI